MIDCGSVSSWAPIPLDEILNGNYTPVEPSMLSRTDGRCLIYPERIHTFQAEPEALKTWLALKVCAERLRAGENVLYIDYEDSAPSVVRRLLELGLPTKVITDGFTYLRPDEPLTDITVGDLDAVLGQEPSIVVIDGVTEAFSAQGLSPLDNTDVATWLDILPRKIARAGASVVLLDHVVKDREARGRYAIGAQHKLAGVDVAYSMRVLEPFARGRDGLVSVKVEKDRPGRVREFAVDGQVALLRARSLADGQVSIKLEPPERGTVTSFRPTVLMERISVAVEANPGSSKRAIRETVSGKNPAKDRALELLTSEGYIEARRDGQTMCHHSVKTYREADEQTNRAPVPPPCPNRAPGTGDSDRAPVPHPLTGGTGTEHNNGHLKPSTVPPTRSTAT